MYEKTYTFSTKKREAFRLVSFHTLSENIGGGVQKRPAFRPVFQKFCVRTWEAEYKKNRRDTENDRSHMRLELNLMDDYDVHEVELKADSTAAFFKHKSSICI